MSDVNEKLFKNIVSSFIIYIAKICRGEARIYSWVSGLQREMTGRIHKWISEQTYRVQGDGTDKKYWVETRLKTCYVPHDTGWCPGADAYLSEPCSLPFIYILQAFTLCQSKSIFSLRQRLTVMKQETDDTTYDIIQFANSSNIKY